MFLQTKSLQSLDLHTTYLPHQFLCKWRAGKGQEQTYPSTLLYPWAVRASSDLKSVFCLICLIQSPCVYWFFCWEPADYCWINSLLVTLQGGEGRETGRWAKGGESASAFDLQCKPWVWANQFCNLLAIKVQFFVLSGMSIKERFKAK